MRPIPRHASLAPSRACTGLLMWAVQCARNNATPRSPWGAWPQLSPSPPFSKKNWSYGGGRFFKISQRRCMKRPTTTGDKSLIRQTVVRGKVHSDRSQTSADRQTAGWAKFIRCRCCILCGVRRVQTYTVTVAVGWVFVRDYVQVISWLNYWSEPKVELFPHLELVGCFRGYSH